MLPAAEKTRSTPAEEAGAAKYCLTILASAGHLLSFACHHASTLTSSGGSSVSARYCSSSSSSGAGAAGEAASFLTRPPSSPPSETLRLFFGGSVDVPGSCASSVSSAGASVPGSSVVVALAGAAFGFQSVSPS